MCGIFGFTHPVDDQRALLAAMGRLQVHRGPDGEGSFLAPGIAMGMRRLSIIDVAHGNQPFYNASGTVAVICNGEIYNYRELRDELKQAGYRFTTSSDVEVIPHLYDRYGIGFVHRLNGMFAIALYDSAAGKLFLVRDRLGIKPLYYARAPRGILFSSELRSILAAKAVDPALDLDALSTYCELLYVPAPLSPFRNIRKLGSGSYASWDGERIDIVRYWEPKLDLQPSRTEEAWLDEIDALLKDSVNLELRSDVPVGSFLSGGVDSSLVTALAAKASPLPFSTFHMRWNEVEGKIDESPFARMVAERYGTVDTARDVSEIDLARLLPKLIWHLEEPFADAAFVPTYILSRIASERVKVILSGAGGDELFGGYAHHLGRPLLRSLATRVLFGRDPSRSYFDTWKRSYLKRWQGIFPWYTADVFRDRFEERYERYRSLDRSNAVMLADISCYLQDDILFLTDKMTMATSLECRVPLLDHRLVELSLRIPSGTKLKDGTSKYLLKKLGERYLPREVLYRPKEGFGSPVWLWVNEYRDLYFDAFLANGFLRKNGMVDRAFLDRMTASVAPGRRASWLYWQVLILEIWCRLFLDGARHDELF